jgi:hypothetical protein
MNQNHYSLDGDNRFVIDQYNDLAPFASFLPGIAGVMGRPAWVFMSTEAKPLPVLGRVTKTELF